MRAGEGGGEAEGGDQHQGEDPVDHGDHGDHTALPGNREHGENSLYFMRFEQSKGMACVMQKSSEIDRRTDK